MNKTWDANLHDYILYKRKLHSLLAAPQEIVLMLSLWWQETHKWHEHGQVNELRKEECFKVWQEGTTKQRTWRNQTNQSEDLHLILFSFLICCGSGLEINKHDQLLQPPPSSSPLQHSSVMPAVKACICKSRASLNTHRKSNGMEQTGQPSNGKLSFTSTDIRA